MLHSENYIINKINRLHERASRIVYSDHTSSFEGLLNKENSFLIHGRNIQGLATEIYIFLRIISLILTHMHFKIDKNFIPEILRHLDMKLKPCHIWHLKFGAGLLKLSK